MYLSLQIAILQNFSAHCVLDILKWSGQMRTYIYIRSTISKMKMKRQDQQGQDLG